MENGQIVFKSMASPITEETILRKNDSSMRSRMEILIMEIQYNFCKKLAEEEKSGKSFKVDRWLRDEGSGKHIDSFGIA